MGLFYYYIFRINHKLSEKRNKLRYLIMIIEYKLQDYNGNRKTNIMHTKAD